MKYDYIAMYFVANCCRHLGILVLAALGFLACSGSAGAATIEFNATGGTTATNGLRFYIDNTTKIQVQVHWLNNTGQVYAPGAVPPSNNLDNGVFIRGNGLVYGPSHTVSTFNLTGGMYNTSAITATVPANPATSGVQQTVTGTFGTPPTLPAPLLGDGVSSWRAVAASSEASGTTVRSGRLRLSNAYGSELLSIGLPIPTVVEFYDAGPAGWRAGPDFCTNLTASNFAFTEAAPACNAAVASCTTALSTSRNGSGPYTWAVNLSKPTAVGSMCVTLNLDGLATGLQCTATGTPGPASTSVNALWLKECRRNRSSGSCQLRHQ